jgi:hypothetical protein
MPLKEDCLDARRREKGTNCSIEPYRIVASLLRMRLFHSTSSIASSRFVVVDYICIISGLKSLRIVLS